MTTFTVANQAQLLSALSSARGGDAIVLKDGNYGSVRVTNDYATNVTIKAEKPLAATISSLEIVGASNVTVDGITFNSGSNGTIGRGIVTIEKQSENIKIINSELYGTKDGMYVGHDGIYVSSSNNVTLLKNNIHDVNSGIVVFGSSNSTVSGNNIDYIGHDAMKYSGIYNSTITDNSFMGHHYPVGDAHPDFIQFQGTSSNVEISGNIFLANTIGWAQGIFMGDGKYTNITIEDNIISTGMMRGISVGDGSGIVVQNNTVLNVPGIVHNLTTIIVPSGSVVNNNIVTGGGTPGPFGTNIRLQNSNPNAAYYVDSYYQNASDGLGIDISDLRPVKGSQAEAKGAASLISDLINGGSDVDNNDGSSSNVDDLRINTGGELFSDFVKDTGFIGGSLYSTKSAISDTIDDALYQTERYGNFNYSFDVEDGEYRVTLKFAELYWNKAGQRIFDVKAESKLILDDLDIFKVAGASNKAWDYTFNVNVSDGKLDLDFITVKDNAKISGIEFERVDEIIFIDSGSSRDTAFTGGKAASTSSLIAGTSDDYLYQTERYGNFQYDVEVRNGLYEVRLDFAEIYWSGTGMRVFDVKAEGKIILDDFDIFRMSGGKNVALEKVFQVEVKDGSIDLDFISVRDNASVSAIEISAIDSIL